MVRCCHISYKFLSVNQFVLGNTTPSSSIAVNPHSGQALHYTKYSHRACKKCGDRAPDRDRARACPRLAAGQQGAFVGIPHEHIRHLFTRHCGDVPRFSLASCCGKLRTAGSVCAWRDCGKLRAAGSVCASRGCGLDARPNRALRCHELSREVAWARSVAGDGAAAQTATASHASACVVQYCTDICPPVCVRAHPTLTTSLLQLSSSPGAPSSH